MVKVHFRASLYRLYIVELMNTFCCFYFIQKSMDSNLKEHITTCKVVHSFVCKLASIEKKTFFSNAILYTIKIGKVYDKTTFCINCIL